MATFKTLDSLIRHVEKNISNSLHYVALEVEKIMKEYIMEHLYNAYTPEDYTRTYDYINSLRIKKVNKTNSGYQVEIYFDTDAIYPRDADGDNRWSSHQNITNDVDVSKYIPLWIEKDTVDSLWDRDGIDVLSNTKKIIIETGMHVKKIQELLKARGIDCKII